MRWKVAIPGTGHGSPVVWGDTVLVVSAVATDKDGPAPAVPVAPNRMGIKPPTKTHQFIVFAIERQTGRKRPPGPRRSWLNTKARRRLSAVPPTAYAAMTWERVRSSGSAAA